jgi:hypothetical protein
LEIYLYQHIHVEVQNESEGSIKELLYNIYSLILCKNCRDGMMVLTLGATCWNNEGGYQVVLQTEKEFV